MKKLLSILILASAAGALPAAATTAERHAGKQPEALLKAAPEFAKAYRDAVRDLDLPTWTKRLAAGTPAEVVAIDGKSYLLTSACSKQGCLDERIYILFDAREKKASGIFFLPPAQDQPGDARTAFSQWYGKPGKALADFLMERAMQDVQAAQPANH